ncbi:heparinase II/III domain-containing protein [Vibrio rumoiensis]|uniref:heparinase II/III domain-containing protein n=1 Tax=Vibrio rumoiensis TaxID=76258 RepID=UPI000B5CF35B|nr:heparinase II/III family protein [Vibrio rumoiensis]
MLQFNAQEMAKIKNKATPDIIQRLIDDNQVVLSSDILVPPDARATWNLYYFCPEHSVRLDWQRDKPTEHCCPVDGKIFMGEPYDGAWWRGLNGLNAKACNELGLLWHLTGEDHYFNKVREILLGYAKYYPDYEEHGGIPYNGPGKANAQTLCEANCNLDFARGYDFIRQALNAEDRVYIETRLLCEGAEFLMQHRSDQLHNHEMKISATVGVIGLIVNKPDYIEFALNSNYGLIYQLEHGVNQDGFWFEGSIHYHYYALQALLAFEKIAYHTAYSVKLQPNYHKMLAFPLQLISATGDFPRLNDCIAGQEKLNHTHIFEFAYQQFNDPVFAKALSTIYKDTPRNSIETLLYGVDQLPASEPIACHTIHAPLSGLTILHNEASQNMMLLKHSPYGGEHDHYDRLGIILCRQGKEIIPDLGTTGYGAEMHYGYYKNTATHNTLAVNQKNQPPANPTTENFQQTDQSTYISTQVDWSKPIKELDSHTIVQWDDDAYKNVTFRRSILWLTDDDILSNVAIDISQISNPYQQQLDLNWHIRGHFEPNQQSAKFKAIATPFDGPLHRMTDCHVHQLTQVTPYRFAIAEQADFNMHIFAQQECEILTGQAPDNPATSNLSYLMLRNQDLHFNAVAVHDLSIDEPIIVKNISWQDEYLTVELIRSNVTSEILINLSNHTVTVK